MAIIGDVTPTTRASGRMNSISLSRLAAYAVFVAALGFTTAVVFGLVS